VSAWARPGVKVVCVDDRWSDLQLKCSPNLPVKQAIYTIRDAVTAGVHLGVRLVEVTNPPYYFGRDGTLEPPFNIRRFRPVAPTTRTQEQDVALFRHLLAPVSATMECQ